jgi:hypothetical protein
MYMAQKILVSLDRFSYREEAKGRELPLAAEFYVTSHSSLSRSSKFGTFRHVGIIICDNQ